MKNGSTPRIRAGRRNTMPTVLLGAPVSARAAPFGFHPISAAIASTRRRVASDTPGCPLRAYDTAPLDTPARAATSAIVGRFTLVPRIVVTPIPPASLVPGTPLGPAGPLDPVWDTGPLTARGWMTYNEARSAVSTPAPGGTPLRRGAQRVLDAGLVAAQV